MQRLKITFALNTFYSGPQAWFFLADDLGFFDEEGLEVTFSPGDTAANVMPRLADESLGFDCGFGDINALIEWCARHGKPCAQVVYGLHNTSPYTLAVPAHSAALSVLDLRGQRIASHPNDAALKLLPELALRCGFSAGDYHVELCSEPHPIKVRDMVQHQRWDAMFGFVNTLPEVWELAKQGRLKVLAVTSPGRSKIAPNVPSIAELGYAKLVAENFVGISGPSATPPAVSAKLNAALNEVLSDPKMIARLEELGFSLAKMTPAAFTSYVQKQATEFTPFVKASGAKLN